MKRVTLLAVLLLAFAPASAEAQANSGVQTARQAWALVTGFFTTAAEEGSDSLYAYRPTAGVRSFGELVGHVAGAQYLICGAAMGESGASEDDIEKTVTAKAGLVAALKASTAYCEKAYAQTDAMAAGSTKLFGQQQSRMAALMLNAVHNGEHYGNIVVYLRMNGIVPPSSRGQM